MGLVNFSKHSDGFIGNSGSSPEIDIKQSPRHFFRRALHLSDQTLSSEVVNEVDATVFVRGGLESVPDLCSVDYV